MKREIHQDHLACRSFGHAWDFTTVEREGAAYVQGLICLRCKSERFIRLSARTGEPQGNRYAYTEGYLLHGGGTLTAKERWHLRLETVRMHRR